jgi:hypothetical protein
VASDAEGTRILVAWNQDQQLHLFNLKTGAHATFPRPNYFGAVARKLTFSPDGKAAYIFNTGGGAGVEAYRLLLDGKEEAKPIFEGGRGELVWASPLEMISRCSVGRCGREKIVHRNLASGLETVLADSAKEGDGFQWSHAVHGSEPGDVLLYVGYNSGTRERLVHFRAKDGLLVEVALPQEITNFLGSRLPPLAFSPSREEAYLVTRPGRDLLVWTQRMSRGATADFRSLKVADLHPPPPDPRTASQHDDTRKPRPPTTSTVFYAFLLNAEGDFLLHWGDDLVLLSRAGDVRHVDLTSVAGGSYEWAGQEFLAHKPEELWVGVEVGASRDFLRVDLTRVNELKN